MEYKEELNDYNTFEIDWDDESDQSYWEGEESEVYSEGEAGYEAPPWPGDGYSSSEYEYEPREEEHELEPLDDNQDKTDQSTWPSEESCEDESWHEENESQFNIGEGDHETEAEHGELYHEDQFVEPYTYEKENDSLISLGETEKNGQELGYQEEYAHESEDINEVERWEEDGPERGDMELAPPDHTSRGYTQQAQSKQGNSCEQFDFQLLTFSGHKQGPESYINWERELEHWFWFYNIPKEERLAHAVNSLVGEASSWWISEELMSHYIKPILTWGDLKQRMYKEFVLRFHNRDYTPKRLMFKKIAREGKKTIQVKEAQEPSKVKEVQEKPTKQMVAPKRNDKSLLDPYKKEQCKSLNPCELHELTCYRCQGKGHKAKECPTKRAVKPTLLELKTDLNKPSNNLANSDFIPSTSSIMHLSLSKDIETVLGATKEARSVENSFIIKEEPPDSHQQVLVRGENMENNASKEIAQMNHEDTSKKIMETSRVQRDSQLKETTTKPWKSVIYSLLIKEEPPDIPNSIKPRQYQGKVLNSQRRMKANLLSIGAGKTVLRTEPLQEGENDAIPRTRTKPDHSFLTMEHGSMELTRAMETSEWISAQMEVKITSSSSTNTWSTHLTHIEDASKKNHLKRSSYEEDIEDTTWKIFNRSDGDIQSLIKALQMLHRELRHKVNFNGFLTQPVNSSKWNELKICLEPKVMDFRSWTFCAKALFAITPKIKLHSPDQKRPSRRTTWRIFLALSRFQQAQERINPPSDPPDTRPRRRRSDPMLFKECPGFACFKGLQTYVWRPGDSLNHSE